MHEKTSLRKHVILVNIVHKLDSLGNYQPLATAFLKAYAEKEQSIRNHFDISLFTASSETFDPDALMREIRDKPPTVIGLSCYIWNLDLYLQALPAIRHLAGDALILAGGPEAHPGLLDIAPQIDAIAIGEGEVLFRSILERLRDGKPWQDTKGIAFRHGSGMHANSPQKLLENLDDIPSPFRMGILPSAPIRHIEYSRGCTNKCSYCVDAGDPYRHMSIQRIEEEIRDCIDSGSIIGLTAGSYLNYKDFGTQVLRLIKKYRDMGHDISIADTVCVDANNDDAEFFNLLDEIVPDKSKLALTIGIQCTHPETLKRNRRVTKMQSIRNIFTRWNFCNLAQLIVGLPGDNIFRVAHTLAETAMLGPRLIQTFPMLIIPNTYLFENKAQFDIQADDMPPHRMHGAGNQEEAAIIKMQMMADSCSMEYNCNRRLK